MICANINFSWGGKPVFLVPDGVEYTSLVAFLMILEGKVAWKQNTTYLEFRAPKDSCFSNMHLSLYKDVLKNHARGYL